MYRGYVQEILTNSLGEMRRKVEQPEAMDKCNCSRME